LSRYIIVGTLTDPTDPNRKIGYNKVHLCVGLYWTVYRTNSDVMKFDSELFAERLLLEASEHGYSHNKDVCDVRVEQTEG
jgi:hypothetical protein